jgi:hypothetical protein
MVATVLKELQEATNCYYEYRKDSYGQMAMLFQSVEDMEQVNSKIGEILLANSYITQEDYDTKLKSQCAFIYYIADAFYYSDEAYICDGCRRITPMYMADWRRNYFEPTEGEIYCSDCAVKDADVYIAYLLEAPCERLNVFLSEDILKKHGFVALSDTEYETGLYGQTDSPNPIYYKLRKQFNDVIFHATCVTPFATEWKVFVRGEQQ